MVKLEKSGIEAWYMKDEVEDQRAENRCDPNEPVGVEELSALGVDSWKLSGTEDDKELEQIRKDQDYNYNDVITCSPEKLPNYEAKLKTFFEEHIHADPEVRYVLEGSGYFDVRDKQDRWIRIDCKEGHLITLPAGIFHRFTLDSSNYIKAMRLFQGEPVWTPINRGEGAEEHDARKLYEKAYQPSKKAKIDAGGDDKPVANGHAPEVAAEA
ncbi:unnamed protein product [Vitrella brassicaformis CCMP3155]|uniref:Acireductone dioxygenase n=2 Tax=Vitrella brassicaformis TaxID=1169539 RepID=A0A0G4G6S5_VITBC|nr:unnamed protein product [Vitrella brassicaformis CCMP3155]|eukprot:CEM24253.1 unnamed protein product [Vitrella brassicaformis CCMP3155]